MAYLFIKLAMRKIMVALSPGNALNMATSIAEIIAPPPPVYEIPSRPSAVGKSCSICKNPIRAPYADLAYHCANPSCDTVCHLAAACSGFVVVVVVIFICSWILHT